MFQLKNHQTDFDKIWYCHAIKGHPNFEHPIIGNNMVDVGPREVGATLALLVI